MTPTIKFRRLSYAAGLPLPERATKGSAGLDIAAAEAVTIWPQQRVRVPSGFEIELPRGYVGMVCPRSGMAAQFGVTVLNAPGIIDSDFRGEIGVILINHGDVHIEISPGDRIAQLVVLPAASPRCIEVDELSDSERRGGFGSTGR